MADLVHDLNEMCFGDNKRELHLLDLCPLLNAIQNLLEGRV